MTIRTTEKTVTFKRPFVLGGSNELLPAGAYVVETDEELLEGISFPAYRRKLTLIHLPTKSGNSILTRPLAIDPKELDVALVRDQAPAEMSADAGTGQRTLKTLESRREKDDRYAIERGEDEGMIVVQDEHRPETLRTRISRIRGSIGSRILAACLVPK